MLRYLSGTANSAVTYGTGGCAGQSMSSGFSCHGGRAGVLLINFVLHLNNLPCTGPILEKKAWVRYIEKSNIINLAGWSEEVLQAFCEDLGAEPKVKF